MPNTNESGTGKVLHLSSIKLDKFLRALEEIGRDEYRPHLANIVYDDYQENAYANHHARESLSARR